MVNLYFTDFFGVSDADLEKYGAFNISLVNDVPLFVDPFLLFTSKKEAYQNLHGELIRYVRFLRDKATSGPIDQGLVNALFTFPEVKQNWLGFSVVGNRGSGLGKKFAQSLHSNLKGLFSNFGNEKGQQSHIEKLCLVEDGVGKDNISDFTTTLIKGFLLNYTQEFARRYLHPSQRKRRTIDKVTFDYETETWKRESFDLPACRTDYVLLTPTDMLTKDDTWISQSELVHRFESIASALPNEQLRATLNNYLSKKLNELPRKHSEEDTKKVKLQTVKEFPQMMDQYVSMKEATRGRAVHISARKVLESQRFYVAQVKELARRLDIAGFYTATADTRDGLLKRVTILQKVIETEGGHLLLYFNGRPIIRERELQTVFRILWFGLSPQATVSPEESNVVIEAKLASNRQIKKSFSLPMAGKEVLRIVFYYSDDQYAIIQNVLKELSSEERKHIVLLAAMPAGKETHSPTAQRTQVFISYSHRDDKWLEELKITLKPYLREGEFDIWDDTRIAPGDEWKEEIQAALERAKIAVLLVSRYFFDSDFIAKNELPPLLDAAKSGGLKVFWIAVSHSPFKKSKIAEYQAANDPSKPLDTFRKARLNKELVSIAEKLESALV